jgi:hypothetical protein
LQNFFISIYWKKEEPDVEKEGGMAWIMYGWAKRRKEKENKKEEEEGSGLSYVRNNIKTLDEIEERRIDNSTNICFVLPSSNSLFYVAHFTIISHLFLP